MNGSSVIVIDITRMEAVHLTGLVEQFIDLLDETPADDGGLPGDPALARLTPAAYGDDDDASAEFRRLTAADLFDRRRDDAEAVRRSLAPALEDIPASLPADPIDDTLALSLDHAVVDAWMRTLAALRLVLASRLDITDETQTDDDDPRFGVYEWLGYRLDGLVRALDGV